MLAVITGTEICTLYSETQNMTYSIRHNPSETHSPSVNQEHFSTIMRLDNPLRIIYLVW